MYSRDYSVHHDNEETFLPADRSDDLAGQTQPFFSQFSLSRPYRYPYTNSNEESIDQMDGIADTFLAVGDYVKYLDPIFSTSVVSYVTDLKKNRHGILEISCNSGIVFPVNHYLAKLFARFPTDQKWDCSKANGYHVSNFTAKCMEKV